MTNKEKYYDNGLLEFFDPLPGYSKEEIRTLKEPTRIELDFWRSGERFKAIKLYTKRNKMEEKIDLITWYFLSMSTLAHNMLREQERILGKEGVPPLEPLDT